MAGHELIDDYLAELARRLPADAVDELADGLLETWHHRRAAGLPPRDAAQAAIEEFGTADQVVRAFVTHAPGRRTARWLLATGPLVGMLWGIGLVAAQVWTWPVPAEVGAAYAATLAAVVGLLAIAATATGSLRRTQLGAVGGSGLVLLDLTMLATVLLAAPGPAWPMLAAIPASLIRVGLTARTLPVILG
ncbi:hypothetical protein GCM10009558_054310 [Virgisporangium aurantiacum]